MSDVVFRRKAVLVDLDGTICNIDHRQHHVTHKPKNWPAFERGMADDTPYDDIIRLVEVFDLAGYPIFFVTGRQEKSRAITEAWLEKYVVNRGIDYEALIMRDSKDHRPDNIVKPEYVKIVNDLGYHPEFILEDRDRVVEAFRAMGLRVLQVKDGTY